MSFRNIWITFEDWTQLRKELKIKRITFYGERRDEYWNFYLSDNKIKEWKKNLKKYPSLYSENCFPRVGLDWEMLKKVKTPGIYNRLLKSFWREGDRDPMFPDSYDREEDMDWEINNFIAWAMNNVRDIDEDTTMEEWKQINYIMNKKMKLTNKKIFWFSELVVLFKEVRAHMPDRELAQSI
tara:strand:+ start:98 stop:643 length:546 start_codon:yes stop_codon:yes gene_type:complete